VEEAEGDGFRLLAERRRWTRLGVYVVHASVVILLAGGLVGSMLGFEGYVNIPEGETVDTIRLRNTDRTMRLPFAIRCDDFEVRFYPSGAPDEFRSSLTLLRGGRTLVQKDIIVNDPLRYEGINIFQSSYGPMQPEPSVFSGPSPEEATLRFTSRDSGMAYERNLAMGETLELPEGGGTFTLEAYRPQASFMGQNVGAALVGRIAPPEGASTEVLLPLRFANFDKMRRGRMVISVVKVSPEPDPGQAARPMEKRYFTGLQVTYDPGVWIVYAGFVLMIAGCFVTFFLSHQQLVVEVRPHRQGSRVAVFGQAHRNPIGYKRRIEAVTEKLASMAGETSR
jgi:cytochrome c biogenesis protein